MLLRVSQGNDKESACQLQKTQETQIWSLDWEDLLEEETTAHSSNLVWKIPWT